MQNSTLDREPSRYANDSGYNELSDLMKTYDLEDFFRKQNPDFFLTPLTRDCNIKQSSVFHFPFSDHDIVNTYTDFKKTDHGPGVWKMNAATITSAQFKECIENLWPSWKNTISKYENITVWWEMIKYKIKQLTIEVSRSLNTSKHTISKYEKRIDEIKDSDKYLDKQEFFLHAFQ